MSPRFVHLHLHSEYSLTDSTIRIPELVRRCAGLGMPAVAITDQSNLFALVKFVRACQKEGLKPIAGADLWLALPDRAPGRITLLCQDYEGYLSLSRLLSLAWLEGHREDRVVVEPKWLHRHADGLILILGRESPVAPCSADPDAASELLGPWLERFPDRLYLELTRCGLAGEAAWEALALNLAARHALPVIASNDVRFLDREDFEAHEARVAIASGQVLADPRRPRLYTEEQYLKSPEEMVERFADLPQALENTVELAIRCNLEMRLGTYFLPEFPVPQGHSLDTWIRHAAHQGLERRLASHGCAAGHDRESYQRRLDAELDVIVRMGFPGYFLIVADFINWAKQQGIPVGPGRGSGAGSLVAWALGITDLDPIPYNLLFERFLNPERVSMPDFDIDFCMDRRDEVIDYVARKYGRDHVSQIITYGTMAAKAVIRDCGRVLGHPYGFVDGIAKLVPNTLGICLEDALGRSEKAAKDPSLCSAELVRRYQEEDEVRELIDLALKLEDLTRNAGKHAGGVVIGPKPLTEFCPLYAEAGGRNPVTQFDKDDVEAIGLVKFDFLGLRNLTIIDWTVKAINARRASEGAAPLDIASIPLDDRATFELFCRAQTVAVFQFESSGMRDLLRRARPDRFEDLIALVSLYRPGPMDLIPSFIARKHGEEEVDYPDPRVEPVLKETYGIMVYQEQVMQMAQILGGYTLGGADLLRRAMGKKKPEEMARHRAMFREGAARQGLDEAKADAIFDLMEKFAGYGFNKSHAAAYALVSYQTAWLKAHYPAEFMAAVLSSDMDNTDKVVAFLAEARALGLRVLPPDVNHSDYAFRAVDAQELRYGLGAIKGVGRGAVEAIVEARTQGGPFRDLLDLCQRVDGTRLNRRVLEAMIHAGALDALGPNRASLLLQLPEVLRATEQLSRDRAAGQIDIFGAASQPLHLELPVCAEAPLDQLLAAERDALGWFLSGHPLDAWRALLDQIVPYRLDQLDRALAEARGRRREPGLLFAGLVTAVRLRGDSQAFVSLEDGHGKLEASFWGEECMRFRSLLTRDRILLLEGSLREDEQASGGWSLRVRQAWDFLVECPRLVSRIDLVVDARKGTGLDALHRLLDRFRPGPTPVRLTLHLDVGQGSLELDGALAVQAEAQLLQQLAAQPEVRSCRPSLARPASPSTNPREATRLPHDGAAAATLH
ncbi:MAG: DNA-directed DNA polymerase [Lysobacteraceae bacterium]|nr:MAG: DNA-directed DNA polymerase [Xanthomonadaceae bacterium]